jgi:hypothetical protein
MTMPVEAASAVGRNVFHVLGIASIPNIRENKTIRVTDMRSDLDRLRLGRTGNCDIRISFEVVVLRSTSRLEPDKKEPAARARRKTDRLQPETKLK